MQEATEDLSHSLNKRERNIIGNLHYITLLLILGVQQPHSSRTANTLAHWPQLGSPPPPRMLIDEYAQQLTVISPADCCQPTPQAIPEAQESGEPHVENTMQPSGITPPPIKKKKNKPWFWKENIIMCS